MAEEEVAEEEVRDSMGIRSRRGISGRTDGFGDSATGSAGCDSATGSSGRRRQPRNFGPECRRRRCGISIPVFFFFGGGGGIVTRPLSAGR